MNMHQVKAIIEAIRNASIGVAAGGLLVAQSSDVSPTVAAVAGSIVLGAHVISTSIDAYNQAAKDQQ